MRKLRLGQNCSLCLNIQLIHYLSRRVCRLVFDVRGAKLPQEVTLQPNTRANAFRRYGNTVLNIVRRRKGPTHVLLVLFWLPCGTGVFSG